MRPLSLAVQQLGRRCATRKLLQAIKDPLQRHNCKRAFSSSDDSFSTRKGALFGDERDEIAKLLIARGGTEAMVRNHLIHDRTRFTHDPVPYSASVTPPPESPFLSNPLNSNKSKGRKVSVVGCGQVGLAAVYALMNQGTCKSISLVDMNGSKLEGEVKDLQQGAAFGETTQYIEGSTEYDVTEDSDLVIITAGAAQLPGQSRLELVDKNVSIMKSIIPEVLKHSPNAAICIASNPCDIMTAVAAKIAGPDLPPGRIFGSGTVLDSGRLCTAVAASLNVDAKNVQAMIIGEHGDSSVPVWSLAHGAGVPLHFLEIDNKGILDDLHQGVVKAALDVIAKKRYTNWAVGMALAHIAHAVLDDSRLVLPVSACVRGYCGVKEDVFASVPCLVGAKGVVRVIEYPLNDSETEKFLSSAKAIWDVQTGVWDTI